MKQSKLFLPFVLFLGLCALSAGAATMSNLYASGSGSGMAGVVGGGPAENHQVMASPAVPSASYASDSSFQIEGLEMASNCSGIGSSYQAHCGIFIANDEVAIVDCTVTSSSNSTTIVRVGNSHFASGNGSGTCGIGPGDYNVDVSTTTSGANDSAEVSLYINVRKVVTLTEEDLQKILDRDDIWVSYP